jgi:hypothetical protein
MGCYTPVEEVKKLNLPLAAERQICGENLESLLGL